MSTRYSMIYGHSSLWCSLCEERIVHINDAMPIIPIRRMQPDGYSSRAFGVDVSFWLGRLLIIHMCMCRITGPTNIWDAKMEWTFGAK